MFKLNALASTFQRIADRTCHPSSASVLRDSFQFTYKPQKSPLGIVASLVYNFVLFVDGCAKSMLLAFLDISSSLKTTSLSLALHKQECCGQLKLLNSLTHRC